MNKDLLVRGHEVVIGLETHAQLNTRSKAFSGSSTAFGAAPNTQASAVDLALPGTLPVLNRAAVECAIRFGLAIGARIATHSIFARKNYFYPDLPKGYQISQYETPVVQGGKVSFLVDGQRRTIALTRAHLEEDAGKSLHENVGADGARDVSAIDLNRAGTPLLEIVTEPDMSVSTSAGNRHTRRPTAATVPAARRPSCSNPDAPVGLLSINAPSPRRCPTALRADR